MSADLLRAKRVGNIVPGRTALVLLDKRNYNPLYYIRGERKLKFEVQKKQSLEKFGCTLTMTPAEDKKRLQSFLLDVEKIDTLANLDPNAAIALVEELTGEASSPLVRQVAEKAPSDYRQARILADLLIEQRTGADGDILRQMSRSQSKGNRRK